MIRKEVKLGFAIGGVFLAVLVVYLMISSDSGKKQAGATIDGGDSTASNVDVKPTAEPAGGSSTPIDLHMTPSSNDGAKPAIADANKPATPIDTNSGKPPVVASAEQPKPDANKELWEGMLNRGDVPAMMSETPTKRDNGNGGGAVTPGTPPTTPPTTPPPTPREAVAGGSNSANRSAPIVANPPTTQPEKPAVASNSESGAEPGSSAPIHLSDSGETDGNRANPVPAGGASNNSSVVSTPSNTTAGQRTHVVQRGETLAKISQAAYGSANYYPHIIRANPGLDPNKMKPGTTINLPAEADVVAKPKTESTAAAVASAATPMAAAATPKVTASEPVDPKSQYRVESGDSLYRISVKLYGNGTEVDKIYDLNKDTIGGNRAKLKLHMVLKLPEPPTVTASR